MFDLVDWQCEVVWAWWRCSWGYLYELRVEGCQMMIDDRCGFCVGWGLLGWDYSTYAGTTHISIFNLDVSSYCYLIYHLHSSTKLTVSFVSSLNRKYWLMVDCFKTYSLCSFDKLKLGRKSYSLDPTLASLGSVERSKIMSRSSYASSWPKDVEVAYATDQLTTAERGRTNEDSIQSTWVTRIDQRAIKIYHSRRWLCPGARGKAIRTL